MEKNNFRFWNKTKRQFTDTCTVRFLKNGDISNQNSEIDISQCSGLIDARNVYIFEGDIVLDFRKHSSVLQFWYCSFNNGSFVFKNGTKVMLDVDTTSFEVVGNIYQNEEKHKDVKFYINY